MKYWKNGFYETFQDGSIEITDEYWQELLSSQCQGKQIVTSEEGTPVAYMPVITSEQLLAQANAIRDSLISAVEWRRARHYDEVALGLEPTEPLLPILEYIQALRDITKQVGYPENIVWPIEP